jgi:hypothetical protein
MSSHLLSFSVAAKAIGGRGHCMARGREVEEYKVGLVWLEGEESRQAVFSWAGG